MFVNELVGALVQLVLFAAVPFIVWLIFARKKCNFFEWIGLKSPKHEGNLLVTILVTVLSVAFYIALTSYITKKYSEGLTTAGSDFAGKGFAAFPAVLAYGFIRTGLSEELLFRGFFLKRIGSKFGFAVGNTVQALLFGLLHGVPFGIATQHMEMDYGKQG